MFSQRPFLGWPSTIKNDWPLGPLVPFSPGTVPYSTGVTRGGGRLWRSCLCWYIEVNTDCTLPSV